MFPEPNPKDSPFPYTHYQTPGLTLLVAAPSPVPYRGLYTASNGQLFGVIGQNFYLIAEDWSYTLLGLIANLLTPVSMTDNGQYLILVDGTETGYYYTMTNVAISGTTDAATPANNSTLNFATVPVGVLVGMEIVDKTTSNVIPTGTTIQFLPDTPFGTQVIMSQSAAGAGVASGDTIQFTLAAGIFGVISDSNFLGANRADYIDTFLIFNQPGTPSFYSTLSNVLAFYSLYIAQKAGWPDNLVSLIVVHREIWLLGDKTTEVWGDVGAANFPFAPIAGVFIQHGCAAPFSVATWDLSIFFVSQDKTGTTMIMEGTSYNAVEISTFAICQAISKYPVISDAIAFVYQQEGHVFYQVSFPTADKTWVYDITTKQWHERCFLDTNGVEHRHRANCAAFAYGKVVVGDWQNGNLYYYDTSNYQDNNQPILRLRSWPHVINDGKRVKHNQFIADIEPGTDLNPADDPQILMSWSDDKGRTFGNPLAQSMGKTGQGYTQPQWRRLGNARDRVYQVSWSENCEVALNGAFLEVTPLRT